MKKLLFVLITLSIFMSACSNKEVKEEKRELTPIANKTYKDYPDWVLQPDYENGVAAVGQAKIGSAGLAFAKQEALAVARGELARIIEVQVDDMFKSYVNSVGLGGEDGVEKVSTSISKQVASVSLKGSEQKDLWISKDNEIFILVGISYENLKKETLNTVKTTLNNDEALWQEFKAKKAQDELESAVNNKFKK